MEFQNLPKTQVLLKVPSGEIRLQAGDTGMYLQFDCECLDALPYCRARCCALPGITLKLEEMLSGEYQWWRNDSGGEIKRRADRYCIYNNEGTCACDIYDRRPLTCKEFHCTRGPALRGWSLFLGRQDDEGE